MGQTLKFGNGTWATKEGSTLAYNDENENYKPLPFNFERDSIATRVNKEGLIEVVGKDIPRIDYTDNKEGVLLLEPSRTNLETKSNDFSTWGTNSNTTRTADYIISPDGTLNGTRLQFTANGYIANTLQSLATYTVSCYAKRNDNGTQNVGFFTNGSGVVNSAWDITSEWKRFTYTFPALNGSFLGIAGVSGADISVYGFQLEGLASYPTSYIPTSGSSVQRASETANGSGNSEVFNDSEGVLSVNISALAQETSDRYIAISDGTTSNRIRFGYTTPVNSVRLLVVVSSSQVDFTRQLSDTSLYNKFAIKYKQNDFAIWANGFEIGVDASGNTPNGLSELDFDNGGGGADFYGKTKEIGYYDTALTDAELEYITSYRSLNELVTELNLNTL